MTDDAHQAMLINLALREELLAMVHEDATVREELAQDGSLFEGYHPRMAEVHSRNARRLNEIIDVYGWPAKSLVGEDGAEAAWRIAQHAIGDPPLQRRCLPLLEEAVQQGEAIPAFAAMLHDRICFNEGRPQRYGTQFDWNELGQMVPAPIESTERVEDLRRGVGLPPLAEVARRVQEDMARSMARPPQDYAARRAEMEAWARSAGWRG